MASEAPEDDVVVGIEAPDSEDAAWCLRAYLAELDQRFPTGFDPAAALPLEVEAITEPAGALLVARRGGRPVGCGAVKHLGEVAEIKRMWVAPEARGLGLGPRLLAELERLGRQAGATVARLDTNESLTEAIAMYRRAGYQAIGRYNDEPHATHWFEKRL